jgi:hypothetical protein
VIGSLFITPVGFVSFFSTSAPLCWRRLPLQLSSIRGGDGDDGRTRALINVVIEMLKGLLVPSSGEWKGDVVVVFKSASSRRGLLC